MLKEDSNTLELEDIDETKTIDQNFTIFEKLYSIWWAKPLLFPFKYCKCMKKANMFC